MGISFDGLAAIVDGSGNHHRLLAFALVSCVGIPAL
jgi:hypothetical protein